ncbi:hypothetical protein [Fructobacillus fructosus]|uniref:hypothetical protein n=1 Tax=Fructobacillus fructosus TaxID=1631 RepID=UPI003CC828ED
MWISSGQHMYLGTVYDLQNREILSYKPSSTRDGIFVSDVLVDVLNQYQKLTSFHNNMGSEYTSRIFENRLEPNNIRYSLSKGDAFL